MRQLSLAVALLLLPLTPASLLAQDGAQTSLGVFNGFDPQVMAEIGAKSVRLILKDGEIASGIDTPDEESEFYEKLHTISQFADVIVTFRFPDYDGQLTDNGRSEQYDRVPSGADREASLALVERFVRRAGPYLWGLSLANEPIGGPGRNYPEDKIKGPNGMSPAAEWFGALAARIKSVTKADPALRHLQVVGPSITFPDDEEFEGGDPIQVAFFEELIEQTATNRNIDIADVHLHVSGVESIDRIYSFLRYERGLEKPLMTTEWSQAKVNKDWMSSQCTAAIPQCIAGKLNRQIVMDAYEIPMTGDQWQTLIATSALDDGFIERCLERFREYGFTHAFYTAVFQTHLPLYDTKAIIPTATVENARSTTRVEPLYSDYLNTAEAAARPYEHIRYASWNGFLGMTNVLEIVNGSAESIAVSVALRDSGGTIRTRLRLTLRKDEQRDIIVNDLSGFAPDSYGTLEISANSADVRSRLFFYRSGTANDYDFAFNQPSTAGLIGVSHVGYNTFQPSLDPNERNSSVLNWLTLVNLESTPQTFSVERYSAAGQLTAVREVQLAPFGRLDIDGGHGEGPNRVGFNVIKSSVLGVRYLAFLTRYGERQGGYAFAFPAAAATREEAVQTVGISSGAGAQNWLELSNVSEDTIVATVDYYSNEGTHVGHEELELAPRTSVHREASLLVPFGQSGIAVATTAKRNTLAVQSMFYFRKPAGGIDTLYGTAGSDAKTGLLVGSYNLFLGQANWLRLFNTADRDQVVTVTTFRDGRELSRREVTLGAKSGTDLGLHETGVYGTILNSYGTVTVEGFDISAQLLRLRPAGPGIDFAAPTELLSQTVVTHR